jgi:hypothetical protein
MLYLVGQVSRPAQAPLPHTTNASIIIMTKSLHCTLCHGMQQRTDHTAYRSWRWWRRQCRVRESALAQGLCHRMPRQRHGMASIRIANPRATSELVVPPEICLRARVTWGDRTTAGSRVDLTARGLGSRSDAVRSCVACVCVSECVCGVNT